MVKICENFAKATKLKFSTNIWIEKCKTKCLIFSKERINYNEITSILLNELPLPFVNSLKHLRNVLQSGNSMTIDCNKKWEIFISKIHSLNQKFYFNSLDVILTLYNIYCCSFYGSSIWDLNSQCVSKLYTAWNTDIRILFNMPEIRIGIWLKVFHNVYK